MGDAAAVALAAMLPHNRTLKTVYLSTNQIGAVGAHALAAAMQSNASVSRIHLRRNPCTGHTAVMKAIAEACQVGTAFLR